jgi:hypothetical protein
MPFLFPYLIGGAVAYVLFFKKAMAKSCPPGAPCVCPVCAGHGAVALTDDSGARCGNEACVACAGTGQTFNPDLNQSGRYDAAPPLQVDVCGLVADARAGEMNARATVDGLLAQGRIVQADLTACLTSPALSTQSSTMMTDGGQGFSVMGSDAVMDTRTAGGAGLTVIPAVNAVSPVLPGFTFGQVQVAQPMVDVCALVRASASDNREAAGQLRTMLDDGMIRITDLDKCKLSLTASDQMRVTRMVNL